MKKFFKRVFAFLSVTLLVFALSFAYFTHRIVNDLEKINSLHYENSYLMDAAIICMQLYLVDPTQENRDTCLQIENQIKNNVKELDSYSMASIYLDYMNKP